MLGEVELNGHTPVSGIKDNKLNPKNIVHNGTHHQIQNGLSKSGCPSSNGSCTSKGVHPLVGLKERSATWGLTMDSEQFALKMDDVTKDTCFRDRFFVPRIKDLPDIGEDHQNDETECMYLCGNSLGLQPKSVAQKVQRELDKWAKFGVHGHFLGEMPWAKCDECVDEGMAQLVGAKRSEVAVMNGLTVNLHLQLISFYRPTAQRYKILLEAHSFPSDHYAIESHVKLHGYDPKTAMVLLQPREGEECLRESDILELLEKEGDSIAVAVFPGVQYYTGQMLDFTTLTNSAHKQGIYVGWDLAHAAGNVEIHLHDWGVDFACWCSYKYINSGAGGLSGFFIHEKHFEDCKQFPRLSGWWSHKMDTRFKMDNVLQLDEGARGFRISNPPVMLCAPLEASLEVFGETSMHELRSRSLMLTAYLEYLINYHFPKTDNHKDSLYSEIITPAEPERRGAQLSVRFSVPIMKVFKELCKRGVVCDKREPNVLRLAPAPLYNTFHDIYRFIRVLGDALKHAT